MESSGNESSRKRPKKTATGSVRDSRASTPVPQRTKKAPGAASDGEATATEMSDSGRPKLLKKKSKLVVGSHGKSTPTGSRPGSPIPGSTQLGSGKLTVPFYVLIFNLATLLCNPTLPFKWPCTLTCDNRLATSQPRW